MPDRDAPGDLEITISEGFEAWLASQNASLAFTTPPAKLFLVGLDDAGELSVFERSFNKSMGLTHVDTRTLYLATRYHLWRLEDDLRPGERTPDGYDRRYVPRHCSATGYVNAHDLAVEDDGRVLMVNTRFGCLVEVPDDAHFRPVWWPHFLPGPIPNDRCHLNGLALRDGRARYVTVVGESAEVDGWRAERRNGGLVMDVPSNEIIATGLSMPHSPRWHDGRLWIANAGTGELGTIDLDSGAFDPIAFLPGFVRGLCFVGHYAVVGSSRPRHGDLYSGLDLDARLQAAGAEASMGLFVVDTRTGETVAWLAIEGPVRELFEVIALPGVQRPQAVGLIGPEIAESLRFDAAPGVLA